MKPWMLIEGMLNTSQVHPLNAGIVSKPRTMMLLFDGGDTATKLVRHGPMMMPI